MTKLNRAAFARLSAAALPMLLLPRSAPAEDFSDSIRRAVVRGAQVADQLDSAWQQVAGEVVPAWQTPGALSQANVPPPFVDEAFAKELLSLTLEAGAQCAGIKVEQLEARLPAARQEAVLLYKTASVAKPLFNEPFYGDGSSASPAGTAVRVFPPSLATAAVSGEPLGNSTLFGFECYVRWRVLQEALSDGRAPAERAQLQKAFVQSLGSALLDGPLRTALASAELASSAQMAATPRSKRPLKQAVEGCSVLLEAMRSKGLFTTAALTLTLGSGTDLFDEGDWQAGGSTSWQYVVSGSVLVGASQLAQDRTAATGQGAGLYPGQLVTAPLQAYLRRAAVSTRVDEYFLDNRVGRPDPRTFSDPRYYSDLLLEVLALEEQ